MSRNILCVGIAVHDHIFSVETMPTAATKVFADNHVQVGGGPASNGAATVVKLGGSASLWARIGGDPTGDEIVRGLREIGVDVTNVRQIAGRRSNLSAVVVTPDGERLIIAYADHALDRDPSWLPLDTLSAYDAVLCDVRWPEASRRVLAAARELGIPTVLDADLTVDDAVAELVPLASHAVFSEPALAKLTAVDDPQAGLELASRMTPGVVSVTLGGDGYAYFENGVFTRQPGFKVEVRDTLAAGDVFHGAFALAIAEGLSTPEAGRFAGATASLKCTKWGGRLGIPRRIEVEAFIAEADRPVA